MSIPDPMTPADCDLRGLPFMPLDVVRLGDSDLFALSTGDEFKAAVILWCKSWLQIPAASLPDDDRILAHITGAGARWPKLKAMALKGWVKCTDGRLYHPVVAEKARDAWAHRQIQRERSRKGNAARWGSGGDGSANPQSIPTGIAEASPQGSPGESLKDRKGQGQYKGEKKDPPLGPPRAGGGDGRGSRLQDDWQPDQGSREFASGLGLAPDAVAAGFRDFWRGKPGAAGRKSDWPATWRNWCRREAERAPKPKPEFRNGFLAVIARDREAEQDRLADDEPNQFLTLEAPRAH